MKKNYTIPIFIISIITTIASILLFIFFLKVIDNKNQHASVVLTTLENKMKEKENAIVNNSKITEIKTLQDSINNYFVNSDKIDVFVGYLEKISSDFGSSVAVESIDIPQKTQNIIVVKLSITGTFDKVMKTITFLENIPYQVDITQIYLNENANQIAQEDFKVTTQVKPSKIQKWQANVSFNILSLN